ncbi:Ribonuclease [Quillaja saponaria]|uniref:Ribonuclease n=1 Tax=Quillaja saponaria TaxID=32244 RepID=A0AAD7P6E2_QUISA|nr:Ribonuclease [Quillaja saponaria]
MSYSSVFVKLLTLQCLVILCVSQSFDFFYFVQQWPGSICDTKRSCCYPKAGKPAANFSIHGLWPNYNNRSWPSFCNRESLFDHSKLSDLSRMQTTWPSLICPSGNNSKFWKHEWDKHGTCSEFVLDQHQYFEETLNIKDRVDLLQILQNEGIQPDGRNYSIGSIEEALRRGIGFAPGIKCNKDASGNGQLHEIYLCVEKTGSKLIECPVLPRRNCAQHVEFPAF